MCVLEVLARAFLPVRWNQWPNGLLHQSQCPEDVMACSDSADDLDMESQSSESGTKWISRATVSYRIQVRILISCWSSSRESVPEKWSSSAIITVSFSHDVEHLISLYGVALNYMYVIILVVLWIISQCLNENKARRVFSVIRGMQATMFRWGTKVPGLDKKVDQTYSPWHSIINGRCWHRWRRGMCVCHGGM